MKTRTKKTVKTLTIIAMLAVAFAAVYFVPAIAQPGDASDPLVTRSFVESRITQLSSEINQLRIAINNIAPGTASTTGGGQLSAADRDALFGEFIQHFETIYGDLLRAAAAVVPGYQDFAFAEVVPFQILLIPAGSTFVAEEGVEFILRAGQATAVTGPDGMVDITDGRDVVNGERIPTNHLLLVPRSDGRGFLANTDVWLMVKGRYQIVN